MFVRVRLDKTTYADIEVSEQSEKLVSGYKVNREGEKVTVIRNGHPAYVLIMAQPDDVVCELQMNLHYGQLEKVKGE